MQQWRISWQTHSVENQFLLSKMITNDAIVFSNHNTKLALATSQLQTATMCGVSSAGQTLTQNSPQNVTWRIINLLTQVLLNQELVPYPLSDKIKSSQSLSTVILLLPTVLILIFYINIICTKIISSQTMLYITATFSKNTNNKLLCSPANSGKIF